MDETRITSESSLEEIIEYMRPRVTALAKEVARELNERFGKRAVGQEWFTEEEFLRTALSGCCYRAKYPWVDAFDLMRLSFTWTFCAISRFKPELGTFCRFARGYIRNKFLGDFEIRRTDHSTPLFNYQKVKAVADRLRGERPSESLSVKEVAQLAQISEVTAEATMRYLVIHVPGYQDLISSEDWMMGSDEDIVEIKSEEDELSYVRQSIAMLSEPDRKVLELRYFNDPPLQFVEIANRLKVTCFTARKRHHRALKRLQVILTENLGMASLAGARPTSGARGRHNSP